LTLDKCVNNDKIRTDDGGSLRYVIEGLIMLFLADLKDYTEQEVKQHLSNEYAGKDGNHGTQNDKGELLKLLDEYNVLVGYESVGNWGCDSSSYFLLQNKVTLEYFETSGSHCSCYGFEGQFYLSPVDVTYLKSDKFYLGCGGYDDDSDENRESVKLFLQTL